MDASAWAVRTVRTVATPYVGFGAGAHRDAVFIYDFGPPSGMAMGGALSWMAGGGVVAGCGADAVGWRGVLLSLAGGGGGVGDGPFLLNECTVSRYAGGAVALILIRCPLLVARCSGFERWQACWVVSRGRPP